VLALDPELARAREDLSRDEEGRQVPHDPGKRDCPVHQVVLVTAVGVALAVGVVLVDGEALAGGKDLLHLVQ
jgi:hypothetical protein